MDYSRVFRTQFYCAAFGINGSMGDVNDTAVRMRNALAPSVSRRSYASSYGEPSVFGCVHKERQNLSFVKIYPIYLH